MCRPTMGMQMISFASSWDVYRGWLVNTLPAGFDNGRIADCVCRPDGPLMQLPGICWAYRCHRHSEGSVHPRQTTQREDHGVVHSSTDPHDIGTCHVNTCIGLFRDKSQFITLLHYHGWQWCVSRTAKERGPILQVLWRETSGIMVWGAIGYECK